jgi:hypothetical protein
MWFWTKDPVKDFPYDITDVTTGLDEKSIWTLHKGKKKVCCPLIVIIGTELVSRNRVHLVMQSLSFDVIQSPDVRM